MSRLLAMVAVLATLILAACGDDESETSASPESEAERSAAVESEGGAGADKTSPDEAETKPERGTEIKLASSDFGEILFDGSDQAIYLFDKETSPTPGCYGGCAAAWPPVLTDGEPEAGSGTDAGLLGTTERDDGSTQVTYNGHPLYYYAHEDSGEVLCHGVDEFGGLWLVVDGAGNALPA